MFSTNGEHIATQVRGDDGVARNATLGDLSVQLPAVNEAALLRVDVQTAQLAAMQAEHEAVTSALKAEHELALKVQADALAALQAEYDDFRARGTYAAQTARAIIANPNINDSDSLAQVDGIAAAMLKDKKAREIEAADKAAAEAAAYAAALRAA